MAGPLRFLLALLSVLALAHAGTIGPLPPPCPATSAPLSSYLALGTAGCAIGGFSVLDFQFAVQPGGTGTPLDAAAVAVTWAAAPAGIGLRFSSSGFRADAGESLGYWISYNLDPIPAVFNGFGDTLWIVPAVGSPPPIIRGGDEEDGGGPGALGALLAAGSVTVDTGLCVGGIFTGPGSARTCSLGGTTSLGVYYHFSGGAQEVNRIGFASPVSTVGVLNSILLEGGDSGAVFWALDNQAYLVPEPASWLMIGPGLALLGLLARRRAS